MPEADASRRTLGKRKGNGAFRVGDRVRCNRLQDEGEGLVIDYSQDCERGLGTKLYPRWLVEFPDGRRDWYNGMDMTKVRS